jgi:hypothetical protein
MTIITRTLRDREMTHASDARACAIRFLEAERTSRGYRYYAPETGRYYRVRARDMASLGAALLADQEDAYSLWCARTHCVELAR